MFFCLQLLAIAFLYDFLAHSLHPSTHPPIPEKKKGQIDLNSYILLLFHLHLTFSFPFSSLYYHHVLALSSLSPRSLSIPLFLHPFLLFSLSFYPHRPAVAIETDLFETGGNENNFSPISPCSLFFFFALCRYRVPLRFALSPRRF